MNEKTTVRVASWNIWTFGPRDYKGIAGLIRKNKIDIIGLQEAAVYHDTSPKLDMTRMTAQELRYNYSFFRVWDTRPKTSWTFGNAIISRFPIVNTKPYMLNPPWVKFNGSSTTEPRLLAFSKIRVGKRTINFLTTHLQFTPMFKTTKIRLEEVKNVLRVINKLKSPIILTGDFNSPPKNKEIKLLEKPLKRLGGSRPTWTIHPFEFENWHEDRLRYRLDNIFISRDLKYKNFKMLKSRISDHLPVTADITVD